VDNGVFYLFSFVCMPPGSKAGARGGPCALRCLIG